jgi:hypothetical protein
LSPLEAVTGDLKGVAGMGDTTEATDTITGAVPTIGAEIMTIAIRSTIKDRVTDRPPRRNVMFQQTGKSACCNRV